MVTNKKIHEEFLQYFESNYPHIYNVPIKVLNSFMKQSYVKKLSLAVQADLFNDFIMSQGHNDYDE